MPRVPITSIELRRLGLPLYAPSRLSYRTFHSFEHFLVRVQDEACRRGFGEGHVSPATSAETRAGGWTFCHPGRGR